MQLLLILLISEQAHPNYFYVALMDPLWLAHHQYFLKTGGGPPLEAPTPQIRSITSYHVVDQFSWYILYIIIQH